MITQRDQNSALVGRGVSSIDNATPISFQVDPVTDYLLVDVISSSNSATTISGNKRDNNDVPTMYGLSSVDNITLVPIRTDANGYLLIDNV